MKRGLSLVLILCMSVVLCSCGGAKVADDGKISIVCTGFSAYDWVRTLAGENISDIDLMYLGEKGVDMHSYQPSAEDMAVIKSCDLLIYTGGESEKWVEDALAYDANPDMIIINMLEVVGQNALTEEELPGLEAHEGHEHEEEEYDEHVWLSVENAKLIVTDIEGCLESIDKDNAAVYKENYNAYMEKLDLLGGEYEKAVLDASLNILVFGDRFPFRYLTEDYGLDYYAAFSGCSAETEVSFETVTFLAGKLDELHIEHIIVIDGSDKRLAGTINESTENKDKIILEMDSIQSVSKEDIDAGYTYIKAMEGNLEVLKQALY